MQLTMASHPQAIIPLLLVLLVAVLSDACVSEDDDVCGITVYWGQNKKEGSLQDACDTGHYKYVVMGFLSTFGNNQTPLLNLTDHCDATSGGCIGLADEIRYCQSLNIKVLLSLGGPGGSYGISSTNDATKVAAYLWTSYFSGSGGPLGDAPLDGVDFYLEKPLTHQHWDDLARTITTYSTPGRKIYLSASPKCTTPDLNLDSAIKTGLFDYVWVQLYNDPSCDYSGGENHLTKAWSSWSSMLPLQSHLFLGLPAAPGAAASGYISPAKLKSEILPVIKNTAKYGGVMLWNRFNDLGNDDYSINIKDEVCSASASKISQVV